MLIIAHHNISDPEAFWAAAKEVTASALPGSLKLHGVYPATDTKSGTCLWEADTVQEVQDFLDEKTSQFAKNFCYEVNVKESLGLPRLSMAAEHLN